ncbi:hypothetical protein [Klebsiella quasipneumoniae]|uniref:hypothetical protein n=5 Tax=Klebsiella pneumoniae complex TaxID=3390273 RepID=UPI00220C0580|nr:hypothetical protein [Klebsiella quasipneumoniae]BDO05640.1 hypothetical protein KAM622c_52270 [Klebsiella quasipneumoniae subsp. quasipneumoniae]
MGLIRTVVYVGIIGGIFAYTQTKDSLENISVPDAEFPSSISRNNFIQSTWVNEHYTSLKNGPIADGISSILDDAQDIRGSVNNVVMTAGNVDIQKAIQDAVDELDSNSRKSSINPVSKMALRTIRYACLK